jgi:hypothetical protein
MVHVFFFPHQCSQINYPWKWSPWASTISSFPIWLSQIKQLLTLCLQSDQVSLYLTQRFCKRDEDGYLQNSISVEHKKPSHRLSTTHDTVSLDDQTSIHPTGYTHLDAKIVSPKLPLEVVLNHFLWQAIGRVAVSLERRHLERSRCHRIF